MLKGKRIYSIFRNKCPRCHEGQFWKTNNPYTNMLINGGEMHSNCSACNLKYEKEVGFWYGAMYVSYAIGIAIFVAFWIATHILLPLFFPEGYSVFLQIGIVVAGIVLLAPINWFLSRLIWINFFVKYHRKDNSELSQSSIS